MCFELILQYDLIEKRIKGKDWKETSCVSCHVKLWKIEEMMAIRANRSITVLNDSFSVYASSTGWYDSKNNNIAFYESNKTKIYFYVYVCTFYLQLIKHLIQQHAINSISVIFYYKINFQINDLCDKIKAVHFSAV